MNFFTLRDSLLLSGKGHDVILQIEQDDYQLGVVCDGVSNSFEPEVGAQIVSSTICEEIKQRATNGGSVAYDDVYRRAVECLQKEGTAKLISQAHLQSCHATTVITALVKNGSAEFSYVGNGAIFEIRPEWFDLPEQIPTPWGLTNYLNPHSRFIDGENRLTKTIQAHNKNSPSMPEVIRLQRFGGELSYYMICTDGLYSSDEIATAWGNSKDYYIIESRRLVIFLELLRKHHLARWNDRIDFSTEFGDRLKREQLLSDDLSYILFVPEP